MSHIQEYIKDNYKRIEQDAYYATSDVDDMKSYIRAMLLEELSYEGYNAEEILINLELYLEGER